MLNKYLNITNQTNKIFISDYGSRNVLRSQPESGEGTTSSSQPAPNSSTNNVESSPQVSQTSVQMITALKNQKITLQQILDVYNSQQNTILNQSQEGATSSNSSQDNTVTDKFKELNAILSNVSSSPSSPSATTSTADDQITLKATIEKIIDEQYENFTKKNPSLIYGKNEEEKDKIKELFKDHSAYFFLDTLKKLNASNQYKDEIKADELLYQFKNKYSIFLNLHQSAMLAVLNSNNNKYHVNANEYSTSIYSDLINTMSARSLAKKDEVFDKKFRPQLLESADGAVKYTPKKNYAIIAGYAIFLSGLVATTGLFLAAAFTSNAALVGGALSLPTISGISAILALASAVGTVVAIGNYKNFNKKQLTPGNLANRITKTQQNVESKKVAALRSRSFSPVRDLVEESKPQTTEKEPPVANAKKETYLFVDNKSLEESLLEISRIFKKNENTQIEFTGDSLSSKNQEIMIELAKKASKFDDEQQAKKTILKNFIISYHKEFIKNSDRDLVPYQELADCFIPDASASSSKEVPKAAFSRALIDPNFMSELQTKSNQLYQLLSSRYNMPELSQIPTLSQSPGGSGVDRSQASSLQESGGSLASPQFSAQQDPAQSASVLAPALVPAPFLPASAQSSTHEAPVPPARDSNITDQNQGLQAQTVVYSPSHLGQVLQQSPQVYSGNTQDQSDLQLQKPQSRSIDEESAGGAFSRRHSPDDSRRSRAWSVGGDHSQRGLAQEGNQLPSARRRPAQLPRSRESDQLSSGHLPQAPISQARTSSLPQLRPRKPDDAISQHAQLFVGGGQPLEAYPSRPNPYGAGQHGSTHFAPIHPGAPISLGQQATFAQDGSRQDHGGHVNVMEIEEIHEQDNHGEELKSVTSRGDADLLPQTFEETTVPRSTDYGGHAHRQPAAQRFEDPRSPAKPQTEGWPVFEGSRTLSPFHQAPSSSPAPGRRPQALRGDEIASSQGHASF